MLVAVCLAAVLAAFVFIWRGHDVRLVLLATAMGIGVLAGQPGAVFRKTAETLADAKFLLPICSAMGFAHVVRETGCVGSLVELLLRPVARARRMVVPGSSAVAFVVNTAIPSQTSTLAAVGPLSVALLSRIGTSAPQAGAALVFGASVAGALLNPGLAEIAAVAALVKVPGARVVVPIAPGVLLAFAVGLAVLFVGRRFAGGTDDPLEPPTRADDTERRSALKALLPPLPVALLLLSHPALPTHALLERVIPRGLEVFTVMLCGSILTIAVATRARARAIRAQLDGMGYAFAHVITIIAVSAGTAKALEAAGVLGALVDLTSGRAAAAFAVAFVLSFVLSVVSGSGTASSVALITALGPRAAELGVGPLALGGVILFGAEAGRTTSPVAAVLLFGGQLVGVPARTLSLRLSLPCFAAGAAGALYCALALR